MVFYSRETTFVKNENGGGRFLCPVQVNTQEQVKRELLRRIRTIPDLVK